MKFTTEEIVIRDYKNIEPPLIFKLQTKVLKGGLFVAELPQNVRDILVNAQLIEKLFEFKDSNYLSLVDKVKSTCQDLYTRELISQKTVIHYQVETACSYQKDENGNIFPNGSFVKELNWLSGTKRQDPTHTSPYGINIFIKLYEQEVYQYKSGSIQTVNVRANCEYNETDEYKKWLCGIIAIKEIHNCPLQIIDYTPEVGRYFVELIKGICLLNEKLAVFNNPVKLLEISKENFKLLN